MGVGPEVTDKLVLAIGRNKGDLGEVKSDSFGIRRSDDCPSSKRRRPPALPGTVDVPLALHLEVRVQRPPPDAREEVLAARQHPVDLFTGEVRGSQLRHAQIETGHRVARERRVQHPRRTKHGVTLRHAATPRSCAE